ncbi:hypothetical protein QVD17_14401 [Tagetes erecta]|uniref:Uncharacterized protein n=1 Tax=Tagetes erecta TaxID=13708 RepID=A0AAD8KXU5_TARER|nr:hypothetical protein QVD17_14401 [Tagetes erecta]
MDDPEETGRVLPCADDDGNFKCFMCNKYLSSAKELYHHISRQCYSNWHKILPEPEELQNCEKIIVKYKFLHPIPSLTDDDDDDSVPERDTVDMRKVLPGWKVTNKRGRRPDLSHSKNQEVFPVKKCKVVEAEDTKNDNVDLPEMAGGGSVNVGLDFDLNDPVMIVEDL